MLAIMVAHKFRRAPYGGGKFWASLKGSLRVFLDQAGPEHPLLQLLGPSIARDHGESTTENVEGHLRRMLTMPLGPKVEMRRWFTFYDAGRAG